MNLSSLRKLLLLPFLGSFAFGQALYVPGGASGLGNSGNSNVGIGVSSPWIPLQVVVGTAGASASFGTASQSLYVISGKNLSGGSEPTLQTIISSGDHTGPLAFGNGDSEFMRITSLGNVGIGTTVPTTRAHVYGTFTVDPSGIATDNYSEGIRLASAANGYSIVTFGANPAQPTGTQANQWWIGKNGSDNGFEIWGNSPGDAFHILPSGNVGIGTTNPTARLYVNNLDNTVGSVLATTGEGPGELRVHSYTTQPGFCASFGIVHSFYNDENNGFLKFWRGGGTSGGFLTLGTNGAERLRVDPAGNVGIGTTNPTYPLSVNGTIEAKEVIVQTGWSDYVFADNFHMPSLSDEAASIKAEKHLTGIPSAKEVAEHGISLGDMQAKLLAKIEELTLHQIEQEKKLSEQSAQLSALTADNARLQSQVQALQSSQR